MLTSVRELEFMTNSLICVSHKESLDTSLMLLPFNSNLVNLTKFCNWFPKEVSRLFETISVSRVSAMPLK